MVSMRMFEQYPESNDMTVIFCRRPEEFGVGPVRVTIQLLPLIMPAGFTGVSIEASRLIVAT